MNLLVNLVGGQTIPNVQFIKEFYSEDDMVLFITTPFMEGQGQVDWILEATGIKHDKTERLIVSSSIDRAEELDLEFVELENLKTKEKIKAA